MSDLNHDSPSGIKLRKIMSLAIRLGIGLAIMAGAILGFRHMLANKVEAPKRPPIPNTPIVDVLVPTRGDVQLEVRSQGLVRAVSEVGLNVQVTGAVVSVSPRLREGALLEAGEEILRLDDRDFNIQVDLAEAEVVRSRAALIEETARGEQARRDWERMNSAAEDPGDLVLRVPQRRAAEASLASAEARLALAQLQLERTRLVSPYPARVVSHHVDVGQTVSPGSPVVVIHRIDLVEVALPFTAEESLQLNLPTGPDDRDRLLLVELSTQVGTEILSWTGTLVRTAAEVDTGSQQLFGIVEVTDPLNRSHPPLRVGQFVQARLPGRTYTEVISIPRVAVREGSEVLLVDPEGKLLRQPVHVDALYGDLLLTRDALPEGCRICISPVPYAANGAPVRVKGEGGKPGGSPAGSPPGAAGREGS